MTYAIHYENINLITYLLKNIKGELKKLLRVPEMSKSSTLN